MMSNECGRVRIAKCQELLQGSKMSIPTGFTLLKRNEECIRTPEEFNLMNRIVAVQEPIAIGCDARKAK